jgi:hypothetical protein
MFKVKYRGNEKIEYTVYSTKESEFGVLMFLIFNPSLDKWVWVPADDYTPVTS